MRIDPICGVLLLAPAGALAGSVGRRLLARMRRGTRVRAPVCELAVAVLWGAVGALWGAARAPAGWLPLLLLVAWLGVAAGLVDARHRRLPDALTLPACAAVPLAVMPLGPAASVRGLLAGLTGVAVYAGVHLAAPAGLGAGDVKLAGPLGTALGAASWPAVAAAALLAALLTAMLAAGVAVAARVSGRPARASPVPHGPSMLAATWLVLVAAALGGGGG
jgi:leader peptidase (prepilin peptidase) / N-methyltransferase